MGVVVGICIGIGEVIDVDDGELETFETILLEVVGIIVDAVEELEDDVELFAAAMVIVLGIDIEVTLQDEFPQQFKFGIQNVPLSGFV